MGLLIGCAHGEGVTRSVFRGVKDGENAPRDAHVGGITAARAVFLIVKIDFPEDVVVVSSDLELKRTKAVVAVWVIAFGEL